MESKPATENKPTSAVQAGKKPTAKSNKPRKDSPLRQQAKSMFNAAAPPMSSDRFFSDYVEMKRNNVELIFDEELPARIAAPYVKQAQLYAKNKLYDDDDQDVQIETEALVSLTVSRKIMLATPQSEVADLARIKDIADHELFVPKNLAALVANIGKFELDDFNARLKYGAQDLFRTLLRMCANMDRHSQYHGLFNSPINRAGEGDDEPVVVPVPWNELDVSKVVFPTESSSRWMRDSAKKYLDQAYRHTWKMKNQDNIEFEVSYPRLEISNNVDKQMENVALWLGKLSPEMPEVMKVVSAGLATAWKTLWFQRPYSQLNHLSPSIPAWVGTPMGALKSLGLGLAFMDDFDYDSWISAIREYHRHIRSRQPMFAQFLDLTKMPDDKFGTEAQMFPVGPEFYRDQVMMGDVNRHYQEQVFGAHSLTIAKFKNKGRAVIGLAAGLTVGVEVNNNYQARLNGDAKTVLRSFLQPDMIVKF